MEEKVKELQSKINRLQRKNAELFMMADAIQSFATSKSSDQIVDRLLEFCSQLSGARKVFFLSKNEKEPSKKLEEGIFEAVNPEEFKFIVQQTENSGITVSLSKSQVKDPYRALSNCTSISLGGNPERYVVMVDLPLPEKSQEYIEIVSKMTDPFVLALKEKEYSEQLVRSEKALRESEQRWATTLASIGDAVIATDLMGKISFMNGVAEALTGWTMSEALRKPLSKVFKIVNEQTRLEVENPVDKVLRKGLIVSLANHTVLVRKDGSEVAIDDSGAPIVDNEGQISGVVLVFRDITERKKAEDELEEYRKNLEKLVEERTNQLKDSERLAAIGATAGMVGHDIRNPLQAIASDVYLVKSELEDLADCGAKEGIKESIEGIGKNVEYINKIVQDLQDFARPIKPALAELDLEELAQEVLFKNSVPGSVDASLQVEEEAKKLISDPALLKRILCNLVNNAVQAMPQGGKLEVRVYRDAVDILITVRDTGVGIPEDLRTRLFTPLFTTKSKGQGFGLVVVKRMTEALGGAVTFESQEGKGTKFIIRLPPPKRDKR